MVMINYFMLKKCVFGGNIVFGLGLWVGNFV